MNLIENFLETMAAERAASFNTIEAYRRDLEGLKEFIAEKELIELKLVDLRGYIQHLQKQGYSSRSINRKISSVRQFYQFLTSEEIINDNPAIELDLQKQAKNLPKMLQIEEIDQLFNFLNQSTQEPEIIRLSAMIAIIYSAGLRVSELVSLKLNNFEFSHGDLKPVFKVIGKGNKERIAILNNQAQEKLKQYLVLRNEFIHKSQKKDCQWLFPSSSVQGHITRQRFAQLLKEFSVRAGFDPEIISPHVLRHSFASHLLANGADLRSIQELLGHSSINTTQIYTHVTGDKLKEVINKYHPLANSQGL